jgi:hypothetical protein
VVIVTVTVWQNACEVPQALDTVKQHWWLPGSKVCVKLLHELLTVAPFIVQVHAVGLAMIVFVKLAVVPETEALKEAVGSVQLMLMV